MPIGTNFDDFLKEEGLHESCAAAAVKKVLTWQIEDVMTPMDDQALHTWESSRDMAAELEQAINEMLTGQGQPVRLSTPSP